MMTSQLCHFLQASKAVRGADDITTQHFYSQVNVWALVDPKMILLFLERAVEPNQGTPYPINFGRSEGWTA